MPLSTLCLLLSFYYYHYWTGLYAHSERVTALTRSETVVPPVSSAEISFEIVGGPRDDHYGRRYQCPYAQEHAERQDDDAQTLEQAGVRDFHGFRRLHPEDHGYSTDRPLSYISNPHRPRADYLYIIILYRAGDLEGIWCTFRESKNLWIF